jgi:hypothetical protein
VHWTIQILNNVSKSFSTARLLSLISHTLVVVVVVVDLFFFFFDNAIKQTHISNTVEIYERTTKPALDNAGGSEEPNTLKSGKSETIKIETKDQQNNSNPSQTTSRCQC